MTILAVNKLIFVTIFSTTFYSNCLGFVAILDACSFPLLDLFAMHETIDDFLLQLRMEHSSTCLKTWVKKVVVHISERSEGK